MPRNLSPLFALATLIAIYPNAHSFGLGLSRTKIGKSITTTTALKNSRISALIGGRGEEEEDDDHHHHNIAESKTSNGATQQRKINDEVFPSAAIMSAATIMCSTMTVTALGLGLGLGLGPSPAFAVSGGGLDYAGLDISGQDFSNNSKTYKGKDFTQVLAKATTFANSNLQGCRFYKAYLVKADFSNADIRGAALEDTNMEGANLKNAIASGAYFGQSLLDVETAENADFTDATIPVKTLALFCEREDVKGTNPVTGEDTRDSLMCP